MVRRRFGRSIVVMLGLAMVLGCSGKVPTTTFLNPKFDFAYVERVAVLPFENLTADRQAGFRTTRLMTTELLATGAIDVVESGEVNAALSKLQGAEFGHVAVPPTDQIIALGRELGVQAVILGTVTQSDVTRSGAVSVPVVTLDARMIETETGATVWAATHTEKGGSAGARALGAGGQPISVTTRRCVQRIIRTMIQ